MVLVQGGARVASWPLWVDGEVDLSTVDRVARLQLAARRTGCSIHLRHICPHLLALLRLVGMADVLLDDEVSGLGQAVGEAEDREEGGGVQEVVVADDPVA